MAALNQHDDLMVCRECIQGLTLRSGLLDVTPTLPVRDMPEAIAFYQSAGFDVRAYDDGFAFVDFAGASALDLTLKEGLNAESNGAGCYIIPQDLDAWHVRLTAADLPVTPITNQPWGMREFSLTDPSGNRLRIGRTMQPR